MERAASLSRVPVGVTAGLFPGQGSHTSDLRAQVRRVAPELLDRAIELVGEDPFARVGESTRFAQPAIYCASIAGWLECRDAVRPAAVAGHSLGEFSALVAADALDPLSGLELVVRRGELMAAAACEEEGMLAVLRATDQLLARLCAGHEVVIANDNAPGQAVLAGPLEGLRGACTEARDEGARAMWLDVAGAFHSPAMATAVEPFREALEQVEFRRPTITVISSSTARTFDEDVRGALAAAIVEPVRWRETMLALSDGGAETFVDFGPGEILARLVPRNLPSATVLSRAQLCASTRSEAIVAL